MIQPLNGLALIVLLGGSAQWIAWRLGLPSILILLLFGFAAGPVTGALNPAWRLDPDALFGELLFPIVSISVALILYEGGLTLKLRELRAVGAVVRNLITIGAAVTWGGVIAAAMLILDMPLGLAVLVGAVLVVTGPTVIQPLLQHIRPSGPVGPILKWEGIVIDPIGALLALLVFEALVSGGGSSGMTHVALAVGRTLLFGGGLGLIAGLLLALLIGRYWIPDFLQNAISMMLVIAAFAGSNLMQPESGLLAVVVMGMTLANQRWADVERIVEFKENLRVLLLSVLFILLAARLDLAQVAAAGLPGLLFVAVLVLIVRPASVWVSTLKSTLSRNERIFLAAMAPRGIVAAAVSSLFALRLEERGYPDAGLLASTVFLTIIGTVALYGLSAGFVGRRLGVAEANPQGVLIIGAHAWARRIAEVLRERGLVVRVMDNNRANIAAARMAKLPAYHGSALAEGVVGTIDLGGLGYVLAVTPNDWINTLTVHRFEAIFGKAASYQIAPADRDEKSRESHRHLQGRWLFGREMTFRALTTRLQEGDAIKATRLTDEFDYAAFRRLYGERAVPLFVISESRRLNVVVADEKIAPKPGQTIIALVPPVDAPAGTEARPVATERL